MCPKPPSTSLPVSVERFYQIVRELTADLDLRTVLRKALAFAIEITQAEGGSAVVLNEHGDVVSAIILDGQRVHENTAMQLREVLHRGLAGWVANHKEPALVHDTSQDERWLPLPQGGNQTDQRSAMAVPLIIKNQLVGVFTVVHSRPETFTPENLAALQAFADMVSPTMMNALLYAHSRQQARLMQIWAESALLVTSTWDSEEIVRRILQQIGRALRTQAVLLVLRDEENNIWVTRHAAGALADRLLGVRFPPPAQPQACPPLEALEAFAVHTTACALLKDEGDPIGALVAINPLEGRFTAAAQAFLQGMAALASTALRRAHLFEEVRRAHQQYRDLFNDTLDWIFITDLEGRVIEANQHAKESLGYTWEEIRAGTLPIAAIHALPPGFLPHALDDIPPSPPLTYESEVRTRHGQAIPVEVYVHRILLERRPHLQWILRDITERKRLDTLRDNLLAMLYHDLRAPLASLNMSIALLGQSCVIGDNPEVQELLTVSQHALDRLQRLTANMLDLGRLESGQMPLQREAVAPAEVLADAVEIVAPHAAQKEQRLETHLSPHLPFIYADRDVIRRVLINLLENAVKYTPEGGHIQVGAEPSGEVVRFWVKDNGPGIPPEEQTLIFQKYARGRRPGSKGLGLGLAFARLAVQAHGGQIGVHSACGEGATFYFTLPVAPAGK